MKKLYLGKDKKFLGVCAGVADYFNVDPTLIRIAVVCLSLLTAVLPAIVVYVVLGFVFPHQPEGYTVVNTSKKLLKSKDKKISGVCGGLAEYFGIDPTIIRLALALCFLFLGYGLMVYIVCMIMIPTEPEQVVTENRYESN